MKLTTEEQQAQNAIEWIDGLATTNEKQGGGRLGDSRSGFCCLGYGCSILELDYDPDSGFSGEFENNVGLWDEQGTIISEPIGGVISTAYSSLAEANDGGWSFKDISDLMKQNPHNFFVNPVADIIAKHYKRKAQ